MKNSKQFTTNQSNNLYLRYSHIFNIGPNYHRVEIFKSYSNSYGLRDKVDQFESTRKSEILKYLKRADVNVTTAQINSVSAAASEKIQHIVFDDKGKTLESF